MEQDENSTERAMAELFKQLMTANADPHTRKEADRIDKDIKKFFKDNRPDVNDYELLVLMNGAESLIGMTQVLEPFIPPAVAEILKTLMAHSVCTLCHRFAVAHGIKPDRAQDLIQFMIRSLDTIHEQVIHRAKEAHH